MAKHRTQVMAKWEHLFAEHAASGHTVTRFCSERGIATSSFHSALKRKMELLVHDDPSASTKQSVLQTTRDSALQQNAVTQPEASEPVGFVPLHIMHEGQEGTTARVTSCLRVQLSSGREILVDRGFDAETLVRLMAILETGL